MDSRVQLPIKDLLLGALRQFDLVSSLDASHLRDFLATSSGVHHLTSEKDTYLSSQHLRTCRDPVAKHRTCERCRVFKQVGGDRRLFSTLYFG